MTDMTGVYEVLHVRRVDALCSCFKRVDGVNKKRLWTLFRIVRFVDWCSAKLLGWLYRKIYLSNQRAE